MTLHEQDGSIPPEQLQTLLSSIRRSPSHPGRFLLEAAHNKSLSLPQAARQIGVDVASLSRITEGRAPVRPQLALRLETAGWASAHTWLRLQTQYDLAQARRNRKAAWPSRLRPRARKSHHPPRNQAGPPSAALQRVPCVGETWAPYWGTGYCQFRDLVDPPSHSRTGTVSKPWPSCWMDRWAGPTNRAAQARSPAGRARDPLHDLDRSGFLENPISAPQPLHSDPAS